MSGLVSARELAEREKKRLDVKKATYRAILEQFSRKISNGATLGNHEVMLTVPQFMIGFPVYNVPIATAYIQRQLDRLGYTTRRVMPSVIQVTWSKPVMKNVPVIIDHSHDDVPSLMNLAKTAQKIRAKK
jgi:hypothetical protein